MQYQIKENCLTIFLPAEVDHHNAEEIKREADKVIEEQHIKYVIFDFGRTNFMDSSGIGVIMGRYRHIFLLGGEVWAIHTSERMRQILNMSGVTKIIERAVGGVPSSGFVSKCTPWARMSWMKISPSWSFATLPK